MSSQPGLREDNMIAPASEPVTDFSESPVQQIPPAEDIRRRLADLAQERSLLRQLLRVAVRRERATPATPCQEKRGGAA
jgi:hypothetical protein